MIISVLFSDRKDSMPGPKLIKWFEKTDFSHCAMLINGVVCEAVYPKYRKIDYNIWKDYNSVIKQIDFEVDEKELADVMKAVDSLVGKRYSVAQLALIFSENIIKQSTRSIGEMIGRLKINNNRRLICTESVIRILKEIGLKHEGSYDTISLNDFDSIVSKFKKERGK